MAHTNTAPKPSPLVSREDLCAELGISRPTSYRYQRDGYLPAPLRIGPGIVRWRRADIDALLERLAADRGAHDLTARLNAIEEEARILAGEVAMRLRDLDEAATVYGVAP
jgi:predicted DNA-binding transcriptional regulator AlpA